METNVRMWTHDFMNLVFGHSEEKNIFWHEVLLPEVVQYYQYYSLEDLKKHDIRLNALYFALLELVGLKCI